MGSNSFSSKSRNPSSWQREYEAALQEKNTSKLFKQVEVAEAAILMRREALECSNESSEERQTIADALATLQAIKSDRLQFR